MTTCVQLMAIVNVTPDSFYTAGRSPTLEEALLRAMESEAAGADVLDVGGESTRPGAVPIGLDEELNRVIPCITELVKCCNVPISVDTRKWQVAAAAVELGVAMINDVSGFNDPQMRAVAASSDVELCVMHMSGDPQTMQLAPNYPRGVVEEVLEWFDAAIEALLASGVKQERIWLDPGIGFGKSVEDNFALLAHLDRIAALGCPVCVGLSRKSFMSKVTGSTTEQLLPATIALNAIACSKGASMIRVHDIKEHRQALEVLECFLDQCEVHT